MDESAWERGKTKELAAAIRDSVLGPNGLRYNLWAIARRRSCILRLRTAPKRCKRGFPYHRRSRTTRPKAKVLADERCSTSSIRPITLMSTNAKLLVFKANVALAEIAAKTLASPQQGFVASRSIDERIVGLDGAMTATIL